MFSINIGEASVAFDQTHKQILVKFNDDGETAGASLDGGLICVDLSYKKDIESSLLTVVTLTEDGKINVVSWLSGDEGKKPHVRYFSSSLENEPATILHEITSGKVKVVFQNDPPSMDVMIETNGTLKTITSFKL